MSSRSLPSNGSLAVLTTQLNERRAPLFRPNTGQSAGGRQGEKTPTHSHNTSFKPDGNSCRRQKSWVLFKDSFSFFRCCVEQCFSTRGVSGPTCFSRNEVVIQAHSTELTLITQKKTRSPTFYHAQSLYFKIAWNHGQNITSLPPTNWETLV